MNLDRMKWYVTNQESQPVKWATQELVACIFEIPFDVFERYPARIENDALPSQVELAKLIADDGFPEWEEVFATRPVVPEFREQPERMLRKIASQWTRLSVLRHIIETDTPAVVSSDTGYLRIPFNKVKDMLYALPDDFHALFLQHWHLPRFGLASLLRLKPSGVPGVLQNFSLGGFRACFSPAGAQFFFNLWRKAPMYNADDLLLNSDFDASKFYLCDPMVMVSARHILPPGQVLRIKDN